MFGLLNLINCPAEGTASPQRHGVHLAV